MVMKKRLTILKVLDRLNKGDVSSELTTRYRYMILSVDGESDTKTITKFH